VRIAVVYDCLYPHTVGGAERWYRTLAERLCERHRVTYLTRRQWEEVGPETPFETIAVSPGGGLYTRSGRRRIWPPLRFGFGVFAHLFRNPQRYDVVHCASFPYFSVIGARLALRLRGSRTRLVVDWHEVWGRDYWLRYLGPLGGRIGNTVERLAARAPDRSFTFSRLYQRRLSEQGHRAPIARLSGEYAGEPPETEVSTDPPEPPLVVFAGRQIPEKNVPAIPPAIARAREQLPALRALILGDGPDREEAERRVAELGLESEVEIPGRVDAAEVGRSLARASCLLLPSEREGYGLVVVEAVSRATPAIVVAAPDNAATELVEDGVNGMIVPSPAPEELAAAVVRVVESGAALRRSTLDWYRRHAAELSIESSLSAVERAYESGGRV
jgi:glycosyltransferase involved in cell wall biosynthesis